ncbi:MAG: hypothetical protein PUD44_07530 [Clostridiaceae bacterium]|nr:hypothetical protein [Clostridiaceae bacterium]MDY3286794.1 hypothetical protein [Eubacteriales bacterium]MDY5014547.1 hypothetical protein [Eubacteriales bacterium]
MQEGRREKTRRGVLKVKIGGKGESGLQKMFGQNAGTIGEGGVKKKERLKKTGLHS